MTPDPPAPPWSILLPNACRHPNRNGCFFWRPFEAKRYNKLEQTTFCTYHNLNLNTLSSSKLLPSKQTSVIFFCLWLCKHKLEQIPFCMCHNPNLKTRLSSQLLPTNKECTSTPPEAELHKLCFAQCTYSARTVHGTVHATVHSHKTLQIPWDWCLLDNLQKIIKILFFCVFWLFFGKYVVFIAFCGRVLWRTL